MPIFALTCPECDAVLKMANAMPAGKKVKCPKCEAVFPVPTEEEETLPAKVKHRPAPVENAADAPLPDEDDDERRPRRRRKKDKSKEEKRGPSGLVIGLAIAGIVLLVLGAATGGGIYWYLTSGNNSGTGNEDPLAYLPAALAEFRSAAARCGVTFSQAACLTGSGGGSSSTLQFA